MIRKYAEIFCWKNVSSFCSTKATHIFSAKNIRILCIESTKTVNKMTLNELVKLTMLWTTGPRYFHTSHRQSSQNVLLLKYSNKCFIFFFIFFLFGFYCFTALLWIFTYIELIVHQKWAKNWEPVEKTTWPSVSRTWLSHNYVIWARLEPQRWEI